MERRLNRRVLVIEDDTDFRRLITEALTNAGLDVVAAIDAGQALRTALAVYVCGKPFQVDDLVDEVERAALN